MVRYIIVLIVSLGWAYSNVLLPDWYLNRSKGMSNVREHGTMLDKLNGIPLWVKIFYESLDPKIIKFYEQLPAIMDKLGEHYLYFASLPFGNATINADKKNMTCTRGPAECYGDLLHACSLVMVDNVNYVSCLLKKGSNEDAVYECVEPWLVNGNDVINCANSDYGWFVLDWFGNETKKVNAPYFPYVLIDGNPYDPKDDLLDAICKAYTHPPPGCKL